MLFLNIKLPAILSHGRNTTISLETYPFIHLNIKHVTLEIINNWHQSNESGSQLINSVDRKFQIANNSYKCFYVTFEVSDILPLHEVIGSELRGPFEKKKKEKKKEI